jgi:hypothetical protein
MKIVWQGVDMKVVTYAENHIVIRCPLKDEMRYSTLRSLKDPGEEKKGSR